MNKRCLIIGGAGFLGLNLTKGLLSSGYKVLILDKTMAKSSIMDRIDFVQADLMNASIVRNTIQKGDIIFYFACASLPGSPFEKIDADIHQDVEGFIGVIKAAISHGADKIIFPSSGGTVYGNPLNLPISEDHPTSPICYYGVTKLMNEKYLYMFNRTHGLDYLIFRIGNPYGPGQDPKRLQGLIPKAMKKIMDDEKVEVFGDGENIRDYIYIDDVVEAMVKSVDLGLKNDVFNMGTGVGTSINDVLRVASSILKKKPQVEHLDKRPSDVATNILSSSKLYSEIDWKPKVPLKEGMKMTHRWLAGDGGDI